MTAEPLDDPFVGPGVSFLANLVEGRSVGMSAARAVGSWIGAPQASPRGIGACAALALTIIGAPACIVAPVGLTVAGTAAG